MKIYTKRGDTGETDLFGVGRVGKDSLRVDTYGTLDECNASVGLSRSLAVSLPKNVSPSPVRQQWDEALQQVQNDLFSLGAELASPGALDKVPLLHAPDIERLEGQIDRAEAQLPPLRHFVLPAGSPAACALHAARTVARRAERLAVALGRHETLRPEVVAYLNRLSDHLFVHARLANLLDEAPEMPWLGRGA